MHPDCLSNKVITFVSENEDLFQVPSYRILEWVRSQRLRTASKIHGFLHLANLQVCHSVGVYYENVSAPFTK